MLTDKTKVNKIPIFFAFIILVVVILTKEVSFCRCHFAVVVGIFYRFSLRCHDDGDETLIDTYHDDDDDNDDGNKRDKLFHLPPSKYASFCEPFPFLLIKSGTVIIHINQLYSPSSDAVLGKFSWALHINSCAHTNFDWMNLQNDTKVRWNTYKNHQMRSSYWYPIRNDINFR